VEQSSTGTVPRDRPSVSSNKKGQLVKSCPFSCAYFQSRPQRPAAALLGCFEGAHLGLGDHGGLLLDMGGVVADAQVPLGCRIGTGRAVVQ